MLHEHVSHLLLARLDSGVDLPDGTLGVGAHSLARHARVAALLLERREKKGTRKSGGKKKKVSPTPFHCEYTARRREVLML